MIIIGSNAFQDITAGLSPERERNETARTYGRNSNNHTVSPIGRTEKKDEYEGKVAVPTKNYIDNVIKDALTNIKNGRNVEENRKIIKIFSNIIGDNPFTGELKSYYV